ncbi:putative mitochondrial ribosomal protein [Sphaerosporella brunnea]|uniref:Putative mitochondrial ribosomal protein n=1 Tax=Sphaerosporella brunnea TaxID=1250544 RepID=A0A5J5ERA8_9PEZI|nr:putative mitochondrial ribosomal protein [Sphaerosporella brunnea]
MTAAASAPLRRPLLSLLRGSFPAAATKRTLVQLPPAPSSLPRKIGMFAQPKVFHSPRPAHTPRRRIRIHPPIAAPATKDAIGALTSLQLATLDPTGARGRLFSRHNHDAIRVGDILQVRRKNGEPPFAGVLINIRRRGVDTAFLLRGQVTRVGVEVWFKLYSPTIEAVELVQRAAKRKKRAKLYYMRKPQHDIGNVQNIVAQYTRQRAMLRGEGKKAAHAPKGGQQHHKEKK